MGDRASRVGRLWFRPEAIMFAFLFRRRQRRYVWAPAIDFSDRRIAAMLMAFTAR